MKDSELNEVLKGATVPERTAAYWERFPGQVMTEIERRRQAATTERSRSGFITKEQDAGAAWRWGLILRSLVSRPAFVVGVAVVCLAFGFVLGARHGRRSPGTDAQFAEAQKYFRELEALFPNQLEAIVFDQRGTHLVLAQEPNLPAATPLYLKVCGPKGCQRFVTFSGQQIRINGDLCDVLVDHNGAVMLVGQGLVWSGAQTSTRSGQYQIEARVLNANS